jgi:hypothetical protein
MRKGDGTGFISEVFWAVHLNASDCVAGEPERRINRLITMLVGVISSDRALISPLLPLASAVFPAVTSVSMEVVKLRLPNNDKRV